MTSPLIVVLDESTHAIVSDEATRGELPLGGALFKAIALWIRLRRAARDGARIYIARGDGDATTFEPVDVL